MMQHQSFGPDELSGMSDQELVEQVKQYGNRAAEAALLDRYAELIRRVVLGEVRRQGLPPADWDDALQVGRLAVREAITEYRTPGPGQDRPGHFPEHLARVVLARVRDLGREVRRHARHTVPLAYGAAGQGRESDELAVAEADPALLVQRQEDAERLEQALALLGRVARRVVEAPAYDQSLRAVAREEHLPYRAALRLRVRALHFLRWQLGRDTEGGGP